MNNTCAIEQERRTFFVYGSGLIGLPYHRLNDVAEAKADFHAAEAKRAMMIASAWKVA